MYYIELDENNKIIEIYKFEDENIVERRYGTLYIDDPDRVLSRINERPSAEIRINNMEILENEYDLIIDILT